MALNLNAIGKKIGPFTKDYTWKDTVLYALWVGAGLFYLGVGWARGVGGVGGGGVGGG